MMMLGSDITVAIPSYKRSGDVSTLKVAPFAKVWVPASQADEYIAEYGVNRVVAIPDELDGNIARKRNAILDLAETDKVLMLDDDIVKVGVFEGSQVISLTPTHFAWLITEGFRMADEAGVRLWGINQNSDAMTYMSMRPFAFLASVLGPFCGHIKAELRYDEGMAPKEDYDFFLKNIYHYRKVFRFNKYHYVAKHGTGQVGGIVGQRSMGLEWDKARAMERRWGKHFRAKGSAGGKSATGDNILNSLARPGLAGV